MKISKKKLIQIITEEVNGLLEEFDLTQAEADERGIPRLRSPDSGYPDPYATDPRYQEFIDAGGKPGSITDRGTRVVHAPAGGQYADDLAPPGSTRDVGAPGSTRVVGAAGNTRKVNPPENLGPTRRVDPPPKKSTGVMKKLEKASKIPVVGRFFKLFTAATTLAAAKKAFAEEGLVGAAKVAVEAGIDMTPIVGDIKGGMEMLQDMGILDREGFSYIQKNAKGTGVGGSRGSVRWS